MRQEKSHLHAVMVGGYLAEGATDFYTTAERRGTAMKKGHMSRTLSIVCASKLRFNGRYMDVLRSPQELEIIGDPSAKHLTLYTTLSEANTL